MLLSSSSPTARSSLEEMLESIRRRDEKPRDLLPALPSRPTSKARLPASRRSLPTNFKIEDSIPGVPKWDEKRRDHNCVEGEGEQLGFGSFKKVSKAVGKENCGLRLEGNKGSDIVRSGWANGAYFLKKDFPVWCLLASGQWQSGKVHSTSGEDARVMLSDGKVLAMPKGSVLPANSYILEDTDDLVQLSFLNEPSVLHNLCCRYSQNKTYTKAGPVLLAMNTFKGAEVHGNELLAGCRKKPRVSPGIYSWAKDAFNAMMNDEGNQSVIISGESGAGKTQTVKVVVECLTNLGGESALEEKLQQTHVILEAFGNAKTSKHANSSRFVCLFFSHLMNIPFESYKMNGKLIEIHFKPTGKVCGAEIQTFLLEKMRVIQLAKGERSFHVFYQLCAGAPSSLKERLNLKTARDYNYLRQGECLTIGDVDDAQQFHVLMEALDHLQIHKDYQDNAFVVLSAILWLGNISFRVVDDKNHVEVVTDEAVTSAAKLMGCNVQDLISALSTHRTEAGNDNTVQKLTLPKAIQTRDAMAKFMYSGLFDWLTEQINLPLKVDKRNAGKSICILDICGFESFQKNGFEQFCINYANEKLQQLFYHSAFKLEQEEYEKDGIDWKKVHFEDNQECLNLIERPEGLLALFDEETGSPKATDLTFVDKLKRHFFVNPCFKGKGPGAFTIRHYAGEDQLNRVMQCLETTKPHFICCIKPNSKQLPGVLEKDLVLQQLRCFKIFEIVMLSRSGYATRITHQEFIRRYNLLLLKKVVPQDALVTSIAILQHFNIHPDMYQVGYTKLFFRTGQLAALDEAKKRILNGIVLLQKLFRGYQARSCSRDLKCKISRLQSFVRGEIARREYEHMIKRSRAVSLIQKFIRGWLVRKNNRLQKLEKTNLGIPNANRFSIKKSSEHKYLRQEHAQEKSSSIVVELQKQVQKTESALVKREGENAALQQHVKELELRWSEYEAKMKSMEETWKRQMTSLQASLVAARKVPTSETGHPGRPDTSPMCHYNDYDDATSMGTQSPGGSTPGRFFTRASDAAPGRDINGNLSAVNPLTKEFEHQKQAFENDARFYTWKKDYKVKLRDAKSKLQKLGFSESEKTWKWWGKRNTKKG
ncbi:hypothetical protein Sjap_003697 [Stephania japonica]|uniref:Myosin motor domain-containing protein n=1 Tax=Stephania japonica TaxID=461633 RepID=A0AAP0PTU9_9MAGN